MKFGIREIVFVAAMFGLLAASYFLVFKKANDERAGLMAKIEQKQRALADLDRATSGIEDVKGKIDELQRAINFFESKLPQRRQVETVLREISQRVAAHHLSVLKINTLKKLKSAGYSEQPLEMQLAGDFYGFYSFLQDIEKLPRITKITKMELSKISQRDGEMEAKVTLSVFYEPDNAPTATADAR
jgi:type IV pilus assembly protein PilO